MSEPAEKKTRNNRTKPDEKDPKIWPTAERLNQIKCAVIGRIKAARKKAGVTQEELGQVMGIFRPNIVRMERCNELSLMPSCAQIFLAAAALEVSAEWLLTGKHVNPMYLKKRKNDVGAAAPAG